jgi:multimeric flavodoxin WrbA
MKILGFACGTKMGNSEVLLKEALMGTEELGAEVEILRMLDLEIPPIFLAKKLAPGQPEPTGFAAFGDPNAKDDAYFLWEKLMDCDAFIMSAPVYSITPPGYLLSIRDRVLSPRGDLGGALGRMAAGGKIDERALKIRAGGIISLGGATTPHWVSLGLPLLYSCLFAVNVNVVDHIQILGSADPAAIMLDKKALAEARVLGRHVAEGVKAAAGRKWDVSYLNHPEKEFSDRLKWLGGDKGICPVCHTDVMVMSKGLTVECALCGSKGNIKVTGDKLTVEFPIKEQQESRMTIEGKRIHMAEIRAVAQAYAPKKEGCKVELEKYKSYKSYLVPPSKQ